MVLDLQYLEAKWGHLPPLEFAKMLKIFLDKDYEKTKQEFYRARRSKCPLCGK